MYRDIVEHEGAYLVRDGGELRPLTREGAALSELPDGFRIRGFFAGLPLFLMELEREQGEPLVWVFSGDGAFLATGVEALGASDRRLLGASAAQLFRRLWDTIIVAGLGAANADVENFVSLMPQTRLALLGLPETRPFLQASYFYLTDMREPLPSLALSGAGGSFAVEMPRIAAVLNAEFVTIGRDAMQAGKIRIVSPFTGAMCETDISICPTEIIYWYKFHDPAVDRVFYLVASLHHCRVVAVYIPDSQSIFMEDDLYRNALETMFAGSMDFAMLRHLATYGDAVLDYLRPGPRHLILLYGEEHLGHHLWNELGGLDAFLAAPAPPLPSAVYEMSQQSEMFGRLDDLCPELAGRVVRFYERRENLLIAFYRRRLCVMRPTSLKMSNSLRNRVHQVALRKPFAVAEAGAIAEIESAGMPIVVFMLRVENRTFIDPVGFFTRCAKHIIAQVAKVCFVIDGRVRAMQDGPMIPSSNEGTSGGALLEAERQVAGALERELAALGCVVVVNIDKPMGVNLLWLHHSRFFVAPWGTGLAKSRWATNVPGVMLSNSWNLLNHHDLHIYDDPSRSEDPTRLLVVGPEMVEDRPELPTMIPNELLFGQNFDVRFELFAPLLDTLIHDHLAPTPSRMVLENSPAA